MEHVGVDRKGDIRLGVPEPLGDGNNIDAAGDELAGVRMSECMEGDLRHANAGGNFTPIRGHFAGPQRTTLEVCCGA